MIKQILDKKNVFAVVGASNDPEKYGYKVFKYLVSNGYKVYPVNPKRDSVQSKKSYKSLGDLPEKPDVVSVITPPTVSEKVLDQAQKLGIKNIWFQPGAESEKIVKLAKVQETNRKIKHDSQKGDKQKGKTSNSHESIEDNNDRINIIVNQCVLLQ